MNKEKTNNIFTIAGRTYELVPFLKEGESYVSGDTIVERAKELNANLGEEDGAFILEHQDEIPAKLRRKIYLVFTAWRNSSEDQQDIAYLGWDGDHWYQYRFWLGSGWGGYDRLVRRYRLWC